MPTLQGGAGNAAQGPCGAGAQPPRRPPRWDGLQIPSPRHRLRPPAPAPLELASVPGSHARPPSSAALLAPPLDRRLHLRVRPRPLEMCPRLCSHQLWHVARLPMVPPSPLSPVSSYHQPAGMNTPTPELPEQPLDGSRSRVSQAEDGGVDGAAHAQRPSGRALPTVQCW